LKSRRPQPCSTGAHQLEVRHAERSEISFPFRVVAGYKHCGAASPLFPASGPAWAGAAQRRLPHWLFQGPPAGSNVLAVQDVRTCGRSASAALRLLLVPLQGVEGGLFFLGPGEGLELGAIERFQMGFVLPRGIIGADIAPRVLAEDFGAKFGEGGINLGEFLAGIDMAVDGIVLAVRVDSGKKFWLFSMHPPPSGTPTSPSARQCTAQEPISPPHPAPPPLPKSVNPSIRSQKNQHSRRPPPPATRSHPMPEAFQQVSGGRAQRHHRNNAPPPPHPGRDTSRFRSHGSPTPPCQGDQVNFTVPLKPLNVPCDCRGDKLISLSL
jgi:hypothetical protein